MFHVATPLFRSRGAKVSVTKYRFLQQLLAIELCEHTPESLHRSLEKPSETLSASTVWGMTWHGLAWLDMFALLLFLCCSFFVLSCRPPRAYSWAGKWQEYHMPDSCQRTNLYANSLPLEHNILHG